MGSFKRVATKDEKKLRVYNFIGFIVCYIYIEIVISLISKMPFGFIKTLTIVVAFYYKLLLEVQSYSDFLSWLALVLLCSLVFILIILIFTWYIFAIFWGIKNAKKKKLREATRYAARNDITYYRDIFERISPTTISLLINLKIERKKDLTAQLLNLYHKKIIDFENGNIKIINNNPNELLKSEAEFLMLIQNNDFSFNSLNKWEKVCVQEVLDEKYLVYSSSKAKVIKKVVILCLLMILAISTYKSFFHDNTISSITVPLLEKYRDVNTDELTTMDLFRDETFLPSIRILSEIVIGATAGVAIMIIPCYGLIYIIVYSFRKHKLKRTRLGDDATEKIVGIKNFIHDFSNLSQATKEQLILWKDFLIYAIVLEENENIVNEIAALYMIDVNNFKIVI